MCDLGKGDKVKSNVDIFTYLSEIFHMHFAKTLKTENAQYQLCRDANGKNNPLVVSKNFLNDGEKIIDFNNHFTYLESRDNYHRQEKIFDKENRRCNFQNVDLAWFMDYAFDKQSQENKNALIKFWINSCVNMNFDLGCGKNIGLIYLDKPGHERKFRVAPAFDNSFCVLTNQNPEVLEIYKNLINQLKLGFNPKNLAYVKQNFRPTLDGYMQNITGVLDDSTNLQDLCMSFATDEIAEYAKLFEKPAVPDVNKDKLATFGVELFGGYKNHLKLLSTQYDRLK